MNDLESKKGDILIYQNEKGDTKLDVFFENDDVWMSQKSIASLYQISKSSLSEHIKHIYEDGELDKEATVRKFRTVQMESDREVKRNLNHYNFKMILAVGYRVRNNIGNHFRSWASDILTEYVQKGFAMNDDRLKDPKRFGADYFDELLERIRDIRSSEKRFYRKVTDIFATSIDYDGKSEEAMLFFKTVQNKFHFAVHGNTASEVIVSRADETIDNMGLTSFKGVKVRKGDIAIAKNYLSADELDTLNRLVTIYLEFAELQAKEQNPMYMADWVRRLDLILQLNNKDILTSAGKISAEMAKEIALKQYDAYNHNRNEQVALDDFDVEVKQIEEMKKG